MKDTTRRRLAEACEGRGVPMTEEQFHEYVDQVNRAAEPFIPLVNCGACGKPIEEEAVLLTTLDPPCWLHPECYGEKRDRTRLSVWGRFWSWLGR